METPLELELHTLSCWALGVADAPALQALFEKCRGYFSAAERRRPGKNAALERIADALDDGRARLFGFTAGEAGALCGFLELRLHEPAPDAATIVLLLLSPEARRRGLGREIVEAAAEALRRQRNRSLHLGVQAHERHARAFWEAMGFLPEEQTPAVTTYMRPL